jgi:2-keto-4-pentenoate hydratase/2-oxohepta-3-ene-1,7-dioic acid hydratase in catechol pathway
MKLASFRVGRDETFGAVVGDKVVDLKQALREKYSDLRAVLAAQALPELEAAVSRGKSYALSEITFLPVIPNPPKILCIGINYETHRAETSKDPSAKPWVFARFANSQVGHGQPLIAPPESNKFDYEGEIAVIIGKAGRRIAKDKAWEHVAGYAPYNDGSIRDWQRHTPQWIPGKNWVGSGGFGPWMATRGEIADNAELHLMTRVNGLEVQRATSHEMIFPIPDLIEYCSIFTELEPGDVLVTGTPGGVGARREPPLFMKDGDTVEVEISEVGILRNPVKREGK